MVQRSGKSIGMCLETEQASSYGFRAHFESHLGSWKSKMVLFKHRQTAAFLNLLSPNPAVL